MVTAEVSQEPTGWLKSSADSNMPFMVVTADVFQELRGWLKARAKANMLSMVVVVLKVHPTWRAKKALD